MDLIASDFGHAIVMLDGDGAGDLVLPGVVTRLATDVDIRIAKTELGTQPDSLSSEKLQLVLDGYIWPPEKEAIPN